MKKTTVKSLNLLFELMVEPLALYRFLSQVKRFYSLFTNNLSYFVVENVIPNTFSTNQNLTEEELRMADGFYPLGFAIAFRKSNK